MTWNIQSECCIFALLFSRAKVFGDFGFELDEKLFLDLNTNPVHFIISCEVISKPYDILPAYLPRYNDDGIREKTLL